VNTTDILRMLDEEISRLNQVRGLLAGGDGATRGGLRARGNGSSRGRRTPSAALATPAQPRKRRTLSAVSRAKMAEAQKRRWAKVRAK
jgi:hypothetical protein